MTISVNRTKRTYAGNGVNRAWEVDFPLLCAEDLDVILTSDTGEETVLSSGYELNAAKDTLTYPTLASGLEPLTNGWKITLLRKTPQTQQIDLVRQGELDAEVLEQGYDKLTLITQELSEEIDRCLKYAPSADMSAAGNNDELNDSQLAAINSGITQTYVAKIDTHSNQLLALQEEKLAKSEAASVYATQSGLISALATKQNALTTAQQNAVNSGVTSSDVAQISANAQAVEDEVAARLAADETLQTALATKQDTLSTAQLAAVNSGVTTSTVSQVTTNLGYLTGFAPYIQKYEVGNFNTQETVDATDLLSATGALHALDLGLSANTQLNKLTAKGTSGSLANLSSVLVSNVAPFDNGTSPQLDVSYSALNRTALVNLFNSMPYNVGYETVGSPTPTITNGVASFSGSGRLRTSIDAVDWADINSLEIVTKIKTGEDVNIYSAALDYPAVSIYTGGGATVLLLKFSDETAYQYVYARNTEYLIRFVFENNTASFYVNDVLVKTFDNVQKPSISSRQVYYGQNPTGSLGSGFIGTIDLNNTYINVNGVPWFTGKAAMTKTCDVRGCTGTADLTQDDKNIALNKGWALTVA